MATAVQIFHEEEAMGKTYDLQVARRLLRYLKPYSRALVPALVLTLLVNLLRVTQPKFTQYAIDWYIVPKQPSGLKWIALIYVLVLLVTFACSYFHDVLDGLASDAGDADNGTSVVQRDYVVQETCATRIRHGADAYRAHKRISAGTHFRRADSADLQCRTEVQTHFSRYQRRPQKCEHRYNLLLLDILPSGRPDRSIRCSSNHLVRWLAGDGEYCYTYGFKSWRSGRIHTVFSAIISTNSRYIGQIQRAAGGGCGLPSHFQNPRYS